MVVKYSDIRSVPAKQREAIEMDIIGIAKGHHAGMEGLSDYKVSYGVAGSNIKIKNG